MSTGKNAAIIGELTSIRFFAAMAVVLFHVHDRSPPLKNVRLFEKGYLGVDLFFILSGFILSHVYISQVRRTQFSYKSFLINRFARVYPLHLATTLACVALYIGGSAFGFLKGAAGMDWPSLPFHLVAIHAWGFVGHHAWNFPSWSISAELFAYLLFPPIALGALAIPSRLGLAISVVVLGAAYTLCDLLGQPYTALTYNFGVFRILFEFIFGVALFRVFSESPLRNPRLILWLSIGLLAALCAFRGSDILIILTFGAVIFALASASMIATPTVFRHPILVYLGEISYSTYMVHYLVETTYAGFSAKILGGTELGLFAWLGLILAIWSVSIPCYHLIEVPLRDLIRQRIRGRSSSVALN